MEIVIMGAGGFGREVRFLIDRLQDCGSPYNVIGFLDDDDSIDKEVHGLPILGNIDAALEMSEDTYFAFGTGSPLVKKKIAERLKLSEDRWPVLIDPSVILDRERVNIGAGSVICAGSILTTDIEIGSFVTLNLDCTVGHDAVIGDDSHIFSIQYFLVGDRPGSIVSAVSIIIRRSPIKLRVL